MHARHLELDVQRDDCVLLVVMEAGIAEMDGRQSLVK